MVDVWILLVRSGRRNCNRRYAGGRFYTDSHRHRCRFRAPGPRRRVRVSASRSHPRGRQAWSGTERDRGATALPRCGAGRGAGRSSRRSSGPRSRSLGPSATARPGAPAAAQAGALLKPASDGIPCTGAACMRERTGRGVVGCTSSQAARRVCAARAYVRSATISEAYLP